MKTDDQPKAGFGRANNTMSGGESSINRRVGGPNNPVEFPVITEGDPMKTKQLLTSILILAGLFAATGSTYVLAHFLPDPEPALRPAQPTLVPADLPAQTSNGYTATVVSYYADAARLIFQVRVTGGEGAVTSVNLTDLDGNLINASSGWGATGGSDPSLSQIEFNLEAPQTSDRFKGQLTFAYNKSLVDETPLASFKIDFDFPIVPARVFDVHQTVTAHNVDMLVDRVIMTPAYTQVYLCYNPPSPADWGIGGVGTTTFIQIAGKQTGLSSYGLLFDSQYGDGTKGGEPGWNPPITEGRCVKLGFANGDADPSHLTIHIPSLEQSMPEVLPQDQLDAAYPKLLAQGIDMKWIALDHGSTIEYKKLPLGMSEQEAMRKFIEALGYTYDGPWVFDIVLK
jgi:hypothetical protein